MDNVTLTASYVVELIQRIFPFSFALDQDLRIVHVGPRLGKVCPAAGPGVLFTDAFTVFRPRLRLSYEGVLKQRHSPFFIDAKATRVRLRGQMLQEEQLGLLFFVGGPWFTDIGQMEQAALRLDDFTLHDPIVDLLSMVQAVQLALTDAQRNLNDLDRRNRDMRLVLDNVSQGLLTLNLDGTMMQERSTILDTWLGPAAPGQTFWEYISAHDGITGTMFALSWQAILDDFLPLDLCLAQMPTRMSAGARTLAFSYKPILTGEALSHVLVILSDISAEVEHERTRAEQQDLLSALERIAQSRSTFLDFFSDATELVRYLTRPTEGRDLVEVRRRLHTLKGNSSAFGLGTVAALCHQIESAMAERGGSDLTQQEREEIDRKWNLISTKLARLVGGKGGVIEINDQEYAMILEAIVSGESRPQILQMIAAWKHPPVQAKLDHFADQIRDLAHRLGKGMVEVRTESNNLRLGAELWAEFWQAFQHVVRNAVDHGLEDPAEREAAGKPPVSHVTLRTCRAGEVFSIEISDDGRGINWAKVAARAAEQGLLYETHEDLVEALFADGMSTREEVTEYSGRGVGMGAVREACVRLGGRILVTSEPGRGTTFAFCFPAARAALEAPPLRVRLTSIPTPQARQVPGIAP